MSEARLVAIALGYDYISTIHLLLADCKNERPHSIKNFIFETSDAFRQFYDSQRIEKPALLNSVIIDSLPITLELEHTIDLAQKTYPKNILPYHLFLAASVLEETLLYSLLEPKEGLHERLLNYYSQKGITINRKTSGSFLQRLISK